MNESTNNEAVQQLVDRNRRFVASIASLYQGKGKPMDELINAGNEGLETAARKFQSGRDFNFIAYAAWYIRQSIEEVINSQE